VTKINDLAARISSETPKKLKDLASGQVLAHLKSLELASLCSLTS